MINTVLISFSSFHFQLRWEHTLLLIQTYLLCKVFCSELSLHLHIQVLTHTLLSFLCNISKIRTFWSITSAKLFHLGIVVLPHLWFSKRQYCTFRVHSEGFWKGIFFVSDCPRCVTSSFAFSQSLLTCLPPSQYFWFITKTPAPPTPSWPIISASSTYLLMFQVLPCFLLCFPKAWKDLHIKKKFGNHESVLDYTRKFAAMKTELTHSNFSTETQNGHKYQIVKENVISMSVHWNQQQQCHSLA